MAHIRSIALGFVLGATTFTGVASASYLPPLEAAVRLLADAAQATYEIDRTARQQRDAGLRNQLRQQTQRLSTSIDGIQRIVDAYTEAPPVPVRPQGPRGHHGPVVPLCPDDRFARIVQAVEQQHFRDDKKAMLFSALGDQWVTTHQVGTLMQLFAFSSDQVDVADALFDRTVDPENWFELYGLLTFRSHRDDLRSRTR